MSSWRGCPSPFLTKASWTWDGGRTFSDPKPLRLLPDGIDRLFLLDPSRFGGDRLDGVIEGYTTGGYPTAYMNVYYVKVDPSKL